MSKKILSYTALILFVLNIYAWQEVFALADNSYLKVNFLSVGQGDSTFIETPQHHQILIDGGPNLDVLSKLKSSMPKEDRTIDLVILSHPERDHFFGLMEVLKQYRIEYILWSGVVRDTPEYKEWISLLDKAEENGTKVLITKVNQEITLGNVAIDTIYPLEDLSGQELKNTSNNSCVVSRLIFGDNSFLFTGDISFNEEKDIVISQDDIESGVLKVAHHGSKYSTSELFLNSIEPVIAVISVGKNSYGHPSPEALQRLDKFGIKVLRTDADGDVQIVSDGSNIKINKDN